MTPRFPTLFFRQVLRRWARRPFLAAMNIASIALGVAVFLAIQLANQGALTSFQNAVGLVAGKAQLEVRGDLPDSVFPAVAAVKGVKSATPLVEGIVTLPDQPGEYLRLLGVDPFTGSALRVFRLESTDGLAMDLEAWLREPHAVAIVKGTPATLRVLAGGNLVDLTPKFSLVGEDVVVDADSRIAAMDIGWAQELLGLQGRLTSIQIELSDPLDAESIIPAIREVVPPDASVAPPARRGADTETMLAAFQLNLTALSLVSMVVGVFLIYNSLSATVVRHRVEIGILRANGATKFEIAALFLGEGLLCGILGSLLGIAAAGPLAGLLAAPVGQTVSALYALVSVGHVSISPTQVLLGLLVGVGASLVASWFPASEAAGCDPVAVLHPGSAAEGFRIRSEKWLPFGVLALLLSAATAWTAYVGGGKFLGFASVGLLVAGTTLCIPAIVQWTCLALWMPHWMLRLGVQHLVRSLHRSAVTISALTIAAAMTVSVSVMIHSFRGSVTSWLGKTLVADLFIAPAANEIAGLQSFVPQEAVDWAKTHPGIKTAGTFREIQITCDGRTSSMGVVSEGARGSMEFLKALPNAGNLLASHIVVSESYATRHGTKPGDSLTILTPKGERSYPVAGIIKDFTRDSGLILMDRTNFDQSWNDPRVHSLALTLVNPANATTLANEFRENFGQKGEFSIYTNSDLRKRVIEIFDQTFAVTSVLRAIAVFVAIAGVVLSLTTLVVEREREIGVLRSQGASRWQIKGLVLTEATLIGTFSSVLGIASGAAMAMLLTWVINKAFFGWSIELRYPLDILATTPLWLIPSALLAAWPPAERASRIPPAHAIRFE